MELLDWGSSNALIAYINKSKSKLESIPINALYPRKCNLRPIQTAH